tara:strand:- start:1065 stop:1565 length:501 start_codon:yes stop_codon:yes gene_type:complete
VQHLLTAQTGIQARTGSGPLPSVLTTPALDEFETLILWGMRQWMRAHKERRCATGSVLDAFEFSGLVSALAPLNRMMTLLVLGSRRRLAIATTVTAPLSIDEQVLLRILNAARQRQTDLVESRLGMWMEQISVQATGQAALLLAQTVFSSSATATDPLDYLERDAP